MDDQIRTRQITIYDIAKEADVSAATVSRAISGNGYVSEKKKTQILELVYKYNFKPNTFAQNLQSGFSKTIGFVVPHIGNMYFANVYYEFEKWASSHGYMTILVNSKGDLKNESKLFYSLKEKRVDGIVMMGGRMDAVELSPEHIKEVYDLKEMIPFVSCGARAERFGCTGVYTDDEKGVEILLTYLKSRGYKSVCFIGGWNTFYPAFIKKNSALEFGEKLGMDVTVRWLTDNEYFNYDAGFKGMKILLEEGNLPEVICGINDYVAIGAMNAAIGAGLRVPEDIAFTGFDDIGIGTMLPTHITTISPRYEQFSKKVFNNLAKLINDKNAMTEKTSLVAPELVVRESTR